MVCLLLLSVIVLDLYANCMQINSICIQTIQMEKINTTILLDKRREKLNGLYPVKLRVTFERKQKYYPTDFDFTEAKYKKVMFGERSTEKEKEARKLILAFETKASEAIKSLKVFTWLNFENKYFENRAAKEIVSLAFEDYAMKLRSEGRIGTAVSYECAKNSIMKFSPKLRFADVTKEKLKEYEKWMLDNGKGVTTIGIYLRSLRTLFNKVISEGSLIKEYYPFGKSKYEIPTSRNIKKAITLKEISLIYYYKAEKGTTNEMAKDYWLFMYLCNGINVKDMCLLKYENIKGDVLEFERAKTKNTKKIDILPIRVPLSVDAKAIIEKWGNTKNDNSFIFPVLTGKETPERERQLIQQLTQVVNCHMKGIAAKLGIESKLTTYVARHSFASVLKDNKVSIEFISEALGHGNIKTTQSYLAGFADKTKIKAAKALTAFKK